MLTRFIAVIIFTISTAAQQLPEGYELTASGKFNQVSAYNRVSENGVYFCNYNVSSAGDEVRQLTDFRFYENGLLLYTLKDVPGSDLYITNSGISVFIDHTFHFRNEITINFYSPEGTSISSRKFKGAYLFGFSPDGNIMGVGTPGKLTIIYVKENKSFEYPGCMNFDIGVNGNFVVLADKEKISVYSGTELLFTIPVNSLVRDIKIIDENTFCYITKDHFIAGSINKENELYSSFLEHGFSYTDLLVKDGRVFLAANKRGHNDLTSYLSEYLDNRLTPLRQFAYKSLNSTKKYSSLKKDSLYDPIPWPFYPFDSTRTIWNHYEQNMGYGTSDFSYLHQGLDLIVPIDEPTYTVQQGIVKCVLTLGGYVYWRTAVSPVQDSGRSDGWLYAHLIESTIPVFPGDTVDIHTYIGDIVEWTSEWGHIHFVEINDSGSVWFYDDDQWGINFNPLLALQTLVDTIPPVIMNSNTGAKFEFCLNESSIYLNADSLYGDIDIIVKAADYIGSPEWQQPAYKSFYSIARISDGQTVLEWKPGHILNHRYNMYNSSEFEPYAKMLYKRDETHPASSWMSFERDYYHIITNDDADEVLDTSESNSALNTRLYTDGWYRIFVQVYDPSGNSAIDSMDVKIVNGFVSVNDELIPASNELYQNYPNPFNPSTTIGFQLSQPGIVLLKVYDLLGKETAILLNDYMDAGYHQVVFNSELYNPASGLYFYKLTSGSFTSVKKLLLLK
jgi:hypothetical protein